MIITVNLSRGAISMSKKGVIVKRLASIENFGSMNVLCTDKTGTLTQNRLTLGTPVAFAARSPQELILFGALASKEEDRDPIDLAVLAGLDDPKGLAGYTQTQFVPFDPVGKRTESTVTAAQNQTFKVTKGAPQVILELASDAEQVRANIPTPAGIARVEAVKGYLNLYFAGSEYARRVVDEIGQLRQRLDARVARADEDEGQPAFPLSAVDRCVGVLEVLGIISITATFYMGLTYEQATDRVWGQASLTVKVQVLFKQTFLGG